MCIQIKCLNPIAQKESIAWYETIRSRGCQLVPKTGHITFAETDQEIAAIPLIQEGQFSVTGRCSTAQPLTRSKPVHEQCE